jgi:hypothetical protein
MPTIVNVTVTAYIAPSFTLTNGSAITISGYAGPTPLASICLMPRRAWNLLALARMNVLYEGHP